MGVACVEQHIEGRRSVAFTAADAESKLEPSKFQCCYEVVDALRKVHYEVGTR